MSRFLLNIFVFACCLFVVFSFVYTKNYLSDITEKRGVSDFTSLSVSIPVKVFLIESNTPSLQLKGPEELLEHVVTEVTLEKLSIRARKGDELPSGIEAVEIYVSIPKIERVSLEGAGSIEGRGEFPIKTLNISVKGPGHLVLSVKGGTIFADLEGSGQMLLIGVADQATFEVKGPGRIEAVSLLAQNVVVKIEGSGEALVNVMQNLSVEIDGDGTVRYGGKPTLNKKISGRGEVVQL